MKYVRSLDGLRAVAILFVMLFHFYYVLECGWTGVQLFFVLSGYLITTILLSTKSLSFKDYIKRFYWRRILRIFPLYYGYIILVAVIYFFAGIPDNFGTTLPYLLTYTYNFISFVEGFEIDIFFSHFWSLAIEEQFYLFWPFLIFILNGRSLKIMLLAIIFISPLIRWYLGTELLKDSSLDLTTIGELIYRFTPSQIDSFAFGALIPVFNLHKTKSRFKYHYIGLLAILLISFLYNFYSISSNSIHISITSLGLPIGGLMNFQHIWSYSLIALFSTVVIILITPTEGSTSWINKVIRVVFENKAMVEIGKVSYGLYVYHWIVLAFFRKLIHPKIGNLAVSFIVYFIIVYLISFISFHLFEKQFLKLKSKKI